MVWTFSRMTNIVTMGNHLLTMAHHTADSRALSLLELFFFFNPSICHKSKRFTAQPCNNASSLTPFHWREASKSAKSDMKTSHLQKFGAACGWNFPQCSYVTVSFGLGLGSICERLGRSTFCVQQIEAWEHRSSLSWWHSTLIPKTQTRAHCGTQLATFHWSGQFGSSLNAQLLHLHSKQRTSISLWGRDATTKTEDVVKPEGITKAGRPIKELYAAPSITTSKFFIQRLEGRSTDPWRLGKHGCWSRKGRQCQSSRTCCGGKYSQLLLQKMDCQQLQCQHLGRSNNSTTKVHWTSCHGPGWEKCLTSQCQASLLRRVTKLRDLEGWSFWSQKLCKEFDASKIVIITRILHATYVVFTNPSYISLASFL